MNDLPVIGHRAMRKELWDRQGQTWLVAGNLVPRVSHLKGAVRWETLGTRLSSWKEMYGGIWLLANHSLLAMRVIEYKSNLVIFRYDLAA